MEFRFVTNEVLSKEEGETTLKFLLGVFEGLGYTLHEQEYKEIDMVEAKVGDSSYVQEHFYESKITRKLEEKKKKGGNCATGVCSMED